MKPIDRSQVIDPRFPAVILDIKGLVTRSYHSGTDPHPVRDEATGKRCNSASHGAANFLDRVLLPILENHAPINIIAVPDGGNELRRAIFPAYKAKRAASKDDTPEAERKQMDLLLEQINRLLLYLGATIVKVPHREADDVIGALVQGLGDRPKTVYSVDMDLTQLVDEDSNTFFVRFDTPAFMYVHKFERKGAADYIEVEPGLVALFKSLIGDTSDEYPGVSGIGPVKWLELEELLGTDGLYELDRMVSTGDFTDLRETVQQNPELKVLTTLLTKVNEWKLMYYLAKLHPESCWGAVGKKIIKPEWHKRVPDREKALQAMTALGIQDMIEEFEHLFPTKVLATEDNLEEAFELINKHLPDSPVCGFDYEGFDSLKNEAFLEAIGHKKGGYVDVMSQVPTGASYCFGANLQHSVYISTGHKDTANVDLGYVGAVIEEARGMDIPLVIQNAGFEMTVTKNNLGDEVEIFRPHDTRVLGAYHDENMMGMGKDGLKDMTWELMRYRQTEYQELLDLYGADDMRDLTGQQTLDYGCDDSITACHLWVLFRWSLLLEGQWEWFLNNHTAPAHVMEYAFRKGINIDWEELQRLEAADRILIDTGNEFIRKELEARCQDTNLEAVEAFMDADMDATVYQLSERWKKKNDGKAPGMERRDALVAEVKMRHLEASRYEPYREIKRTYEFIGSAAQLRDVSAELGFEPILLKDSAKAVNEWLLNWADVKLTEQQQEFAVRLGAAVGKPLKQRSGPEFEDLREICTQVIQPTLKSDWVGDELNYDSPVQMQRLLYCKLGLPVRRRSKVDKLSFRHDRGFPGSPSTDKKAIAAALAEDCPSGDWRRDLLNRLTEVKGAMTRFELFYTPYPLWKHPADGCIHAGVKDPGTATRRPTSGRPNILQVSKGPTRKMFIPHDEPERVAPFEKMLTTIGQLSPTILIPSLPKRLILAPDFSGQELRITGSEANDATLIKAYTGGRRYTDEYGVERLEVTDIHSLTTVMFAHRYVARQLGEDALRYLPLDGKSGRLEYDWYQKLRGLDIEKQPEDIARMLVDDIDLETLQKLYKSLTECRNKAAKPTNFLITYLGTASTLAENTSMPEKFCEEIMSEVFASFARLGPWQQETIDFARRRGYVTTAYGTRKHLSDDILSKDRSLRSREERRACNHVVQSGAADILHVVETDIYEQALLERYNSYFIAPVYDEIVLDVPLNDNLPELITELAGIMDLTPPGHAIPMMAEFSFGPNWYKQHELGERPCARQIEIGLSKLFTPKEEEKKDAA